MAVRARFVLIGLALALAAYLALSGWYEHRRAGLIGLTETACTTEGRSVTGSDFDDWAALCAWRQENLRLVGGGKRPDVVMIGDSFTERWPNRDPRIVLRGVGGQTSAQVLLRFRQDAVLLRPRIVHILTGTNDLLGLNGPVTIQQVTGNVLSMAELARLHGQAVIIGTIPPLKDAGGLRPRDPLPDVVRLNAALRETAAANNLVLADYHAAFIQPGGAIRAEMFEDDGKHLNQDGYGAMQKVFQQALATTERLLSDP